MKIKWLLLASLLPFVANAFEPSPGYTKFTETADGIEYFLHKKSIKRNGNLVYYWNEATIEESTPMGWSPWIRFYNVINCKTAEFDFVSYTRYGLNNQILKSRTFRTRNWYPIPPGSIAEDFYNYLCKRK